MKKSLIVVLPLLFAGMAMAQYVPPTAATEAVTKTSSNNALREDLVLPTGRTFELQVGSTITVSGTFSGTPSGGTFNPSNIDMTADSIAWATINKTGSSLANLATRNWSDLQSKPTTAAGLGLTNGSNIDAWGAKTIYAGNLVITTGKTLTASNTFTLAGTDGSTLNIGSGGTLGTAAFMASTAFQPVDADLTTLATGVVHSGVWLITAAGNCTYYGTDGTAFNNALTAAGTGDTIRLGPGQYIVGAVSLSNKTGVSIIGSGALGRSNLTATSGGTILAGSLSVAATSTQWTIKDLTIRRYAVTDSNNVFVVAGGTAAVHKGLIRNVSVIEPDSLKSGAHIFEVNGQDITIDNLHTYGPGSGGGHGFSVKCVQRIRITNCSSTGSGVDGLLICADPTFGNSSDIFVDGFEAINPQANGCFINARDASTIDRLTIRNLFINGAPSGFSIGSSTGTATGNSITDAHVQAVGRNITGVGISFIDTASSNVSFDVDLEVGAAPIVNSFVDSGINATIHGRIVSTNYGECFYDNMPLNSMYQCQFQSRFSPTRPTSLGVASGRLRALEATTTSDLYVVVQATYELKTADMVAGDPVWIESGTAAGVHKYVSTGTVDTINVPITGAQVGDQYILLTNATAYTAGTKTAGNVRPGIVVGQFNSVQNAVSNVIADCNSSSFQAGSYGLGQLAAMVYYDAAGSGEAVLGATQSNLVPATIQASLTAHAWPFVYNANLYLGLFAGYTDQAAWIPVTSAKFNSTVTTRSSETSVGWKPASTIP